MITRRPLLIALLAAPLSACNLPQLGAGGPVLPEPIKLATLNIWHDAGNWPQRLPLIVAALRAQDADVIALQEVLEDQGKGLPNQAQTIADALGGYQVRFMSTSPPGSANRFGNAILSRLPIVATDVIKLAPAADYRSAIRVRVMRAGQPVDVVTTHLAWQPDAGPMRAQQLADLMRWLPQDGAALVMMGDFNAPVDEAALASIAIRGLEPALSPGSVDTTLVLIGSHTPRVIDHIFANPRRFEVRDAHRFADAVGGVFPSDHYGVATTLVLKR